MNGLRQAIVGLFGLVIAIAHGVRRFADSRAARSGDATDRRSLRRSRRPHARMERFGAGDGVYARAIPLDRHRGGLRPFL